MKDIADELATILKTYKPAPAVVDLVRHTPVLLLVGISGAGKDTIKRHLIETGKYHHIVSHTTRAPRENAGVMEQDGVEYHFVSQSTVYNMLKNGEFVEAKQYSDNVYGTSAAEIQWAKDTEKTAVTAIEVQGVNEYKTISKNVIAVFVLPPSFDEWQRRLLARYGDYGPDPSDMKRRMLTAIQELREALEKPYYHFVVNEDLDHAVTVIDKIAHNQDQFNKVDDLVRSQAEQLLADLSAHVTTN